MAGHNSSEEKLWVILEIVVKIIEENCTIFKCREGPQTNKIPRDRRILLRKKKKLNVKLRQNNLNNSRKEQLENNIREIDEKLLDSLTDEKIVKEAHAIENIKKKHLKTKSRIGPFEINNEKTNDLTEICIKLVEQYSSSFSQPDPHYL